MGQKSKKLLIFFILVLFILPIFSQAIKIVCWNVLNFPGTTGLSRIDDIRVVLDEIKPDIFVVQEMIDIGGVNLILNQALNHSSILYKKVPFFDGPDTDNAAFYNKKIIKLKFRNQISTDLRDISEYHFKIKKGPGKGAKFRLYSVHLKAGTAPSDKNDRKVEAEVLRTYLNGFASNGLYMACGDFNFYSSNEDGFQVLTSDQGDTDGMLIDPLNQLGYWHDKQQFAIIHTQCPRKTRFGGGAYGGLDDRFDLFLISPALLTNKKMAYVPDSYIAYGNDGKHLNKAVNKPKNKIVSKKIANALHDASDHLPIVIEFLPYVETDPNKIIVYITESGTKYHRATCQYLSKSKIPISLADAVARGYEPCSVCKPPEIK